jgi:hypothetical protein
MVVAVTMAVVANLPTAVLVTVDHRRLRQTPQRFSLLPLLLQIKKKMYDPTLPKTTFFSAAQQTTTASIPKRVPTGEQTRSTCWRQKKLGKQRSRRQTEQQEKRDS